MPAFLPGHTENVGRKYKASKVKRAIKRIEKQALILNDPNLPAEISPMRDYSKQAAILLANRSVGKPFQKGHIKLPGAGIGKPKKSASIKDRLINELKKNKTSDSLDIARRLINMAKAGDLRAIELVMDRVDGKVPNTLAGDKDNPLKIVIEPVLSLKYSKKDNVNTQPDPHSPRYAQIQGN